MEKSVPYSLLLIILLLFSVGCGKEPLHKQEKKENISPGSLLIIGTVMEIDSSTDTSNPDSPCGKVPCNTVVKIDSVLGYGAAFGKPLVPQRDINLKFMFTTGMTSSDLFPNINENFPGVKVGSKFRGSIQEIKNAVNKSSDLRLYRIYEYQIIDQ